MVSGMTGHRRRSLSGAMVEPQWSPLVVSGMTAQLSANDVVLVPQWSPLVVSGMT